MTLIITAITNQRIVQVSDKRLTKTDASGRIHVVDDEANKAICVATADSAFSIAYTGLAEIRKKRTDQLFADFLTEAKAYQKPLQDVFAAIRSWATTHICGAAVPTRYKATSFVLAGYYQGRPFGALISNFEGGKRWAPHGIKQRFEVTLSGQLNPAKTCEAYIVNGAEAAVTRLIRHKIKGLARAGVLAGLTDAQLVQRFVALLREASDTPKVGRYIGKNCMSVTFQPTRPTEFQADYHPEHASPASYVPHLILNGASYTDLKIWAGPDAPPWWGTST